MAAALLTAVIRRPLLGAVALLSALTVIMTWPVIGNTQFIEVKR